MPNFIISSDIFSRYDIYMFFLGKTPNYNADGDKIVTEEEYYFLENFFANKYSCDCTDCGGEDVSRQCAVENEFKSIYGHILKENLV